MLRVRVVRLLRSSRSHLLSQLPGKRLYSPNDFHNVSSTAAVLNTIGDGKRNRADEDSLEVIMKY